LLQHHIVADDFGKTKLVCVLSKSQQAKRKKKDKRKENFRINSKSEYS